MYYIERGLKMEMVGAYFCTFLAPLASFGIGSSVQSNTVAFAVENSLGVETWITGYGNYRIFCIGYFRRN